MSRWQTGTGIENAGNADFRNRDFVGFYKNLSNSLLCHDGLLVIMM